MVKKIEPPKSYATNTEIEAYDKIRSMFKNTPIPDAEITANLILYVTRPTMGKFLFMHELYLKALNTHGVIMEFGTRWGKNMVAFSTFRNIYEPHNFNRKIIGFDTFEGFPEVSANDYLATKGYMTVSKDYQVYLGELLSAHEQLEPRSNIKKHHLVKGNVIETLPVYLKNHPETVIALAYFDLDLYEPTKKCLEVIKPYLAKNSIIGFDELNYDIFPGETQALREVWGTSGYELHRSIISPHQSYLTI